MEFTFEATNGGYVKVRNKESGSLVTYYYEGKTQINRYILGFDFIDPHHCSVDLEENCKDDMISLAKTPTQAPISVTWQGWRDDVLVFSYLVSIFELYDQHPNRSDSQLVEKSLAFESDRYSGEMSSSQFYLSHPGVYALVLTAYDKAENSKSARIIFIYDAVSSVGVVHDTRLLVSSSASRTSHRWQWNTTDVSVDWVKRYINTLHYNNGWLKQAASLHDVTPDYDDNKHSRGIDAIDHVQGIVEYRTAFLIDHSGGSSILSPPPDANFQSQGLTQHQTVTPVLVDGDTFRFWVRAYDIRRELLQESVTVHVDTSPPVIENLWLTRVNISVHKVDKFNEMTFEWLAFDDHSGLETVSWRLYDNITGSDIDHREEHLSAQGDTQTLANCTARYGDYARGANCYCTPGTGCYHRHFQIKPRIISSNLSHGGVFDDMHKGVHDSDYFIEITVMNHAKLNTSLAIKVKVDAPHPGIVHDGQSGHPEVDYQDSLQLHAHWDRFFDKENGIAFYQYTFGPRCLQGDVFDLNETKNMESTNSTEVTWTAPSCGKYYVTVVAYNGAQQRSDAVCSDGVETCKVNPLVGKTLVPMVSGTVSAVVAGVAIIVGVVVWKRKQRRQPEKTDQTEQYSFRLPTRVKPKQMKPRVNRRQPEASCRTYDTLDFNTGPGEEAYCSIQIRGSDETSIYEPIESPIYVNWGGTSRFTPRVTFNSGTSNDTYE
ncbi:uncharacterized protein [Haliotis cracherodii]|uniref:uncharacterized protein n=1 Tax=Haliotis cracherodii TaxID=6455 RepID=UPI0039E9FD60